MKIINDWQYAYGLGKNVGRWDAPGVRKFFRDAAGAHPGWPDPNTTCNFIISRAWVLGLVTEYPRNIGGAQWFTFRGWNRHTLKHLNVPGHAVLRRKLGDYFRGISARELQEGIDAANAHACYRRKVVRVARVCIV